MQSAPISGDHPPDLASSGLRPSRLDVDLDRLIDACRVNAKHVMDAAMPHARVIAVMAKGR